MSVRAYFGAEGREALVAIARDGRLVAVEHGEDPLLLFDRAARAAKIAPSAVVEIAVDRGPGGFSIVRRRVAVATALAASLGARLAAVGPIEPAAAAALSERDFGRDMGVAPLYDRPPNITQPKKRAWNAR
jgi:tRNA A37 threonylcarbamoyladenosine modification protein TsaB